MASKAEITSFISDIAPLIQREGRARGYKIVSTAIAQACIESRWGLSGLAKYHNYFGMKCGSSWKGAFITLSTKEEYTQGQLTTIRDSFRAFNNMLDGVKGYYDFISSSRYANLKTATTPRQYAEYLKSDGYATSSSYVTTLVNVIGGYALEKYDIPAEIVDTAPKTGNPYREPLINVKFNSRGNNVRWLQFELNRRGYKLIVDGDFRDKTKAAVIDFQHTAFPDNPEEWDGIVGKKTREKLKEKERTDE